MLPNQRPAEEDWRDAKDDLVERITQQQRELGVPVNQTLAEEYALESIARVERRQPRTPPPPAPEPREPEGDRGVWDLENDRIILAPESREAAYDRYVAAKRARESDSTKALRQWYRGLLQIPEWKAKFDKLVYTHGTVPNVKYKDAVFSTGKVKLTAFGHSQWINLIKESIRLFGRLTPETRALTGRIKL